MEDLGALKHLLGIQIVCGFVSLFLSQRKYTFDNIFEVNFLGAKSSLSIIQNHQLALAIGLDFTHHL